MFNPKDGSVITDQHPVCNQEDVDNVVKIAAEAFLKGPWPKFTGAQRGDCLTKFADLLEEHAEEAAYYESVCSGRVMSQLTHEIPWIARVFRYYAGWCDKLEGESFTDDDGFYKIVRHEPIGVCAGITPWNGALFVLALKAAPALATGNTFILKPPEKSPMSSLFAATLFEKAGFPPGVFQIITGDGATGSLLSSHMGVQKVSFTGSIKIGKIIQEAANSSNMKRVTLELGGKSPALVFEDADMPKTVKWLTLGGTMNAGQNCTCPSRIYVHEAVAEKFIAGLKENFEHIASTLGSDPIDQGTSFGPVVDKAQYENVHAFIARGKEEATLITGGYRFNGKGFYIPPTIFINPSSNATIYKDEIFGPVVCVKIFKTEEEVVEWANDSEYGLAGLFCMLFTSRILLIIYVAYIFSESYQRIFRVSKALRAGTVGVNAISQLFPQTPFGGYKSSGQGRELGKYALTDFTEPKTIFLK